MRTKWLPLPCLLVCFVLCRGQSPEIEKIQQGLPRIQDSSSYVDAMNRLAMLLYEKNVDSTFYYTKKAREIADRLQYALGQADALNNLGIVYDIKGNFQFALRYYNEAYTRYAAMPDSANTVQTLMNIAGVYQEMGKDEKAIDHYKRAFVLGNHLSHDSIMSLVIFNYLNRYAATLSTDSARASFNRAREIATRYKDDRVLLVLDEITAANDIKAGHPAVGIELLDKAIDKAMANHLYYLCMDLILDAADQLAASDSARAVNYFKQALAITWQKGYMDYSEIFCRRLYDLYTEHKDNNNALFYSRQLIGLYDKQDSLNKNSGVDYIDYAIKDQQLQSSRLRSGYQSAFLVLAAIICILMIYIIVMLWRNWRKTQRTTSALRMQFEQSETTAAALETANNNYARLLKVVAHDLRNPIGAIDTIASMLVKKTTEPEPARLMQMIQTSTQSSLALINELLAADFEQQLHLTTEKVQLDDLLEQCVSLLSFRAKDKKQHLILGGDKNIEIELDKDKIVRVINNLVVNAIKFSPLGGDILISMLLNQQNVVIKVKDAGIGIPPSMQDKIFDPFTAAKRKGTSGERPFGLGLYISKQIVQAHHGKIGFISEPGNGTDFFVELPLISPGLS